MATIDIRHPHGTDPDDAAARTRALVEEFAAKRAELVKDISWSRGGRRADMTGKGFKGSFDVTDREVVIAIDLALLARPLKGRIESTLNEKLQQEFSA
ncbi:MAG: polyhydroxyalkanoic acid system family protein [Myxococcota bacterium]